jgi:uroporphyrinogen-III synthase
MGMSGSSRDSLIFFSPNVVAVNRPGLQLRRAPTTAIGMAEELRGLRIVVPETRELGQLVRMLEERGAEAVLCPMIAIRDAPDPAPIEAWLRRFASGSCDDLVLLTGEGLRRLLGFARRFDLEPAFVKALTTARKITRGPKPVRALREIGLASDLPADEPTTEGIIAVLERQNLRGRCVGVQLYPDNANERLLNFLEAAGAKTDPVLPYVYTPEADDRRVLTVIAEMDAGRIDAIAFTSAPQVRRFRDVARTHGREGELQRGLARIAVAAVGPIVAAELKSLGVQVDITPRDNTFFMKPLVRELVIALTKDEKR